MSWLRSTFQSRLEKLGEGLTDQLLDALMGHKEGESRLTQLQAISNWPLMHFIARHASLKFCFRQDVTSASPFSFPWGLKHERRFAIAEDTLPEALRNRRRLREAAQPPEPRRRAVGKAFVRPIRADMLCLGDRAVDLGGRRGAWQLVVTAGDEEMAQKTPKVPIQSAERLDNLGGGQRYLGGMHNHHVSWHAKTKMEFDLVDPWGDLVFDLLTDEGSHGWSRRSPLLGGNDNTAASPTGTSTTASPPPNEAEFQDMRHYGRVVIPLSSVLASRDFSGGKSVVLRVQLYQPGAEWKLYKWVRPVPGYTGVGCKKTPFMLGVLTVSISIQLQSFQFLALWRSLRSRPARHWHVPTNFEPQNFETACTRFYGLMSTVPAWVGRFYHVFSLLRTLRADTTEVSFHGQPSERNTESLLSEFSAPLFLMYHLTYIYTVGFSPLWQIPLGIGVLIVVASLSYKFSPSLRDAQKLTLYPDKNVPSGLPAAASLTPPSGEDTQTDRGSESASPSHVDSGLQEENQYPHGGRAVYLSNPLHLPMIMAGQETPPPETAGGSQSRQSVRVERFGYWPHRHCGGPSVEGSKMQTPFGELTTLIADPRSYCPRMPLYADDAGQQIMVYLMQCGWAFLDWGQTVFGSIATAAEKLGFALDWQDPLMTPMSYLVIALWITVITGIVYLVSSLPPSVLRLATMLPLPIMLVATDPEIVRGYMLPMARQLAITVILENPESVLSVIAGQHLWDLGFSFNGPLDRQRGSSDERDGLIKRSSSKTTEDQKLRQVSNALDGLHPLDAGMGKCRDSRRKSSGEGGVSGMLLPALRGIIVLAAAAAGLCLPLLLRVLCWLLLPLRTAAGELMMLTYGWWVRVPDRREMEHRSIAVSAYFDYVKLLKSEYGSRGLQSYLEDRWVRRGLLRTILQSTSPRSLPELPVEPPRETTAAGRETSDNLAERDMPDISTVHQSILGLPSPQRFSSIQSRMLRAVTEGGVPADGETGLEEPLPTFGTHGRSTDVTRPWRKMRSKSVACLPLPRQGSDEHFLPRTTSAAAGGGEKWPTVVPPADTGNRSEIGTEAGRKRHIVPEEGLCERRRRCTPVMGLLRSCCHVPRNGSDEPTDDESASPVKHRDTLGDEADSANDGKPSTKGTH